MTFGTPELADAVEKVLVENPKTRVVLLANHGDVCYQSSLPKAFGLATNIEFTAQIQWQCMAAGEPKYLTDEQMAAAMERSKTYGQQTK